MTLILKTERLYLRELTPKDAHHFYSLNADADVLKYTGDVAFKTISEARSFLENYEQYQLYQMGRWAVCLKTNDTFLGWCGLKFHPNEQVVDIGYRFYKTYWNNGYATESTKGCLNYGFTTLDLKTIYAHAHVDNLASHRVLIKCGLCFTDETIYEGMPIKRYKIENPNI